MDSINEDDLERVANIKQGISVVCDGCSIVDSIRAMQIMCIEMTGEALIESYPDLTKREVGSAISAFLEELVGQAIVMGPILEKHY